MPSNYEAAMKAEAKRVVRRFHVYSASMLASIAATHGLSRKQSATTGRYIYTHPDVPGVCFKSRGMAAEAALRAQAAH